MSEGLSSGKGTYAWWAKVKRLCKLNRPQPPIPDLEYQGTIAVTDAEKTHIFCHQFAQHSQAPPSVDDSSNDIPTPLPPDVFTFQSLSVSEVFQALSSLSVRKSTAGKISNRILRQISGALAASLTALYNRTLESQCLPQEWKEATVIPLYKGKGDRADPSNYRPISLLNGVAKVCESLLSRQVYCYVEECNLISPKQFGFRRHRSTVDQLIYVTSTVSRALDSLSLCDEIFLDFSKAFDQTSHRLIAQCLSSWCAPSACINSLPDVPKSSDLTLFADDSNLVCVSPPNTTLDVHRERLQSDANSCMEWSTAAEAQFHTDKCVHLPFRESSVAAGHARLNVEMGGKIYLSQTPIVTSASFLPLP